MIYDYRGLEVNQKMSTQTIERLFFALWPDQTTRQRLVEISQLVASGAQGKVIAKDNLHLTLVFVGEVNQDLKPCLLKAAAAISGPPFTLVVETLSYQPRNQILWLGASQVPPALQTLVAGLNAQLGPCGYRPETRPYQAHITLMRKAVVTAKLPTIAAGGWRSFV